MLSQSQIFMSMLFHSLINECNKRNTATVVAIEKTGAVIPVLELCSAYNQGRDNFNPRSIEHLKSIFVEIGETYFNGKTPSLASFKLPEGSIAKRMQEVLRGNTESVLLLHKLIQTDY